MTGNFSWNIMMKHVQDHENFVCYATKSLAGVSQKNIQKPSSRVEITILGCN